MKKGLFLFVSVLFLTTTFLISCGDDDNDENGSGTITQPPTTDYGKPSIKLGRYISDCKKTNNASRSEQTIIDITEHYLTISKYEYSYTASVSCEEENNTSILELAYPYTKEAVFKGADKIKINLLAVVLVLRTQQDVDYYNSIQKYDIDYWEINHAEDITDEFLEENSQHARNGVSMLVKSSEAFLYVLPFKDESTPDVLTSTEKYSWVNPSLSLGTYISQCEESDDNVARLTRFQLLDNSIVNTITYYSFEGETPLCEEANKLYKITAEISYNKGDIYAGGYITETNLINVSATILNEGFVTTANDSEVEDLCDVQGGWEFNTPRDITEEFLNDLEEEDIHQTFILKTVGNILYLGLYNDELSVDPVMVGLKYTKEN